MNLWTHLQSFLSRFKAIAVDPEVNQRLADVDDELDRQEQRPVIDLPPRRWTPDRVRSLSPKQIRAIHEVEQWGAEQERKAGEVYEGDL